MIEKKTEGLVTILTINNPPMNVLSSKVLQELSDAFDQVEKDQSRVVILTGEGRAFVAGADISEMKSMSKEEALAFSKKGQSLFSKIENFPKVVIAAVNGFALGGGTELAMSCDIIIASEKAKFGQPEVNLALIPGFGGTQRLPRLVGKMKAKELIFTADIISAEKAKDIGMVNAIVEHEKLMEKAKEMAEKIASKGPAAVRWAKEAVNKGLATSLEKGFEIERELFGNCFETEDQKEGMAAFLEKRKPQFKDK